MKTPPFAIICALAVLTTAGCASHAAKLELRPLPPNDAGVMGGQIIREVALVLEARGFTRDPEAQVSKNIKAYHPDAITWSKQPRTGGQQGGLTVWFWVSRGAIEITIDAKDDGRGVEFEATRLALWERLEQRFPDLPGRARSWKYLNMK